MKKREGGKIRRNSAFQIYEYLKTKAKYNKMTITDEEALKEITEKFGVKITKNAVSALRRDAGIKPLIEKGTAAHGENEGNSLLYDTRHRLKRLERQVEALKAVVSERLGVSVGEATQTA